MVPCQWLFNYSNRKGFDVSPHCFIPQPDVDSTVIKLVVNEEQQWCF